MRLRTFIAHLRVCALSFFLLAPLMLARAQDVDATLRTLAAAMASSLERSRLASVTVLDLADLQGRPTELGRYLAQELSDKLVGVSSHVSVVDRANLQHLLRENKLSIDGLVNPETTRRLGKLVGVDSILVGTVTPLGDSFRVNVRAIAIETSKVAGAQATNLPASRELTQLFNRGVASAGAGGGASPSGGTAGLGGGNLQTRLRSGALRVTVKHITTFSGNPVVVGIDLENVSGEQLSLVYHLGAFLVGTCPLQSTRLSGLGETLYTTPAEAKRAHEDRLQLVQPGEKLTFTVTGVTRSSCDTLEDAQSEIVSFRLFAFDNKEGVVVPVRAEGPVRKGRR